jgi:hypothetical protein
MKNHGREIDRHERIVVRKKLGEKESCVRKKTCWSHRFLPMGSAIVVSFSLPFAMTGKQKEKQYQVSNHPPDSG